MLIIIVILCLPAVICQIDPCTDHLLLDNVQRSVVFELSGTAISDDRIPEGWYRVVSLSGEEIPTEPPGFMRCGTLYPIWLNGTLPTVAGTQVTQPVCVETILSQCDVSWNIDIRRCPGGFLVYNLVISQQASAAYCFGTDIQCPEGEYSENGFSPGCSAAVPLETFSPVVIADLAEGRILNADIGPSLEPVFNCSFNDVAGQFYAYDVEWYINGESCIIHKRLDFSDISQSLLRPVDWVNTYHLNMIVSCRIKARLNATSVPGPMFESPLFEAGIKLDGRVYNILEGEEKSIPFTSTVPVGCIGSIDLIRRQCTRTLKIAQPKYQGTPSQTCTNAIKAESLAFETQDCGLTLSTDNWREKLYLNVTGYVDNVYNLDDRTGHIRLTTDLDSSTDLSGVWNTVVIPDIQVYVSDQDSSLTSRVCRAWNDPTYRTADGRLFSYHGAGEFIFYRHKRYPYWVHILTTACSWNARLTCICGVAVRSHNSLFVVRACDVVSSEIYASGRHYPSITYSVCDNKHMVIEQLPNNRYKVILPIGTEISFYAHRQWNPVIILKPSLLDIEQSEGLCGYISKTRDTSDDLIPRGSNTTTSSSEDYVRSWRVPQGSDEELFSPLPKFPQEDPFLKEYCLCAAEAGPNDDIAEFVDVHCNLTAPVIQCKNTRTPLAQTLHNVCHRERQTRDAEDTDDIIEDTPLTYDPNFDPNYLPPESVWRNGWDETTARQTCIKGIRDMPALELCKAHANIQEEDYIESCIEDIKTAGTSDLLKYTLMLIQSECQLEISRNESLWINKTEDDRGSILEEIENLLCSQNCSKNGYCNRTACICNMGFIGPECSTPLSNGPIQLTIPEDGQCNTRLRSCRKTNIFGEFLIDIIYCQIKHFIITENGKELSGKVYTKQAVYSYENKISCTLPEEDRKRRDTTTTVEGYEISLSYDQVNYGESVSIIIYDGQCHTCNTSTFTCERLVSCLNRSEENTDNGRNDDDDDDDHSDNMNEDKKSTPLVVSVTSLSILLVVILVTFVVYKVKLNKDRKTRRNSCMSFQDAHDVHTGVPPISGNLPAYKNISFEWPSRASTPTDLFVANSCTH